MSAPKATGRWVVRTKAAAKAGTEQGIPALHVAAAKRIGTPSPAVMIDAAPAALATEDDLGPWLAKNWGVLANTPAELLDQIDL